MNKVTSRKAAISALLQNFYVMKELLDREAECSKSKVESLTSEFLHEADRAELNQNIAQLKAIKRFELLVQELQEELDEGRQPDAEE